MHINGLVRLLTGNCQEMDNVFIFNRRGQDREWLPVLDAKVCNLKVLWSRKVDLLKQGKIIIEHLKIYDCSDPMFDEPGGACFVRFSPAPENILPHQAKSGDRRVETAPA